MLKKITSNFFILSFATIVSFGFFVNSASSATVTTLSFSQSSAVVNFGQTTTLTIYGNSNNGYRVESNTKPYTVFATVEGSNLILTAGTQAGSSVISVCAIGSKVCKRISVTTKSSGVSSSSPSASSGISFSQNSVYLSPGQSQSVSVSGGGGTAYRVESNTNPKVGFAEINGSSLVLTANNARGTTKIKVCSTSIGNSCATLTVTVSATTAVSTGIRVSQNNVILNHAQTIDVNLFGGSGSYRVYFNSKPGVVVVHLNNSTLSLNGGDTPGTSIVTVCSGSGSADCANISVYTSSYTSLLSFSQQHVTLNPWEYINVIVYYGTATGGFVVPFNSNPDVVTATIASSGRAITLIGGAKIGSAVVSVCSSVLTYDCSNIYIKNVPPPSMVSVQSTVRKTVSTATPFVFNRDLKYGTVHTDVKHLQKYLNNNGFKLVAKGSGSPGKETTKFSILTKNALTKFQKAKKITPTDGVFGKSTRDYINSRQK